ncbi:basic helix-loop-helix (bHLH) DNA-binding superfamily protein [Arabidopsis thaliana]|jgi:hypothetical protein|uniref:ALC n=2 Tax=Arabidopsis thaliana TaxID=3702 RepID=A0A178UQY8_ARATH|nr:basic helix-loop-helix (bHLH) DNA-binding superfamily protein [Arabidopsis thaliana]AED98302.1 basic helix-loop-helix (bHLH) DNA-binding superfamily protein [Arabidopsis thaliana]OAO95101.1 ALC [Arabidopsis thaliana]|eukprot:NP_001078810.1 basic helix-loop-helix (bHLH) DNA-binding superfamily protein [Arabidopsis thaliana]
MGDSDVGDRLPPPSSSDELSSFLRQILSRTPTAQPSSPPKSTNVSSAETFFPSVSGGAVSSVGYGVSETGQDKYAFEHKRSGAKQRNSLKRNIDAQFHNLSEKKRRSKINEKMKALQKLIPNSNKVNQSLFESEIVRNIVLIDPLSFVCL